MPAVNTSRSLQFGIHFVIWAIILFFPMIFLYSEGERQIIRYLDFSLPLFILMIVFYTNYNFIISRYLFNKKIGQFFLVNLVLFALCLGLLTLIRHVYFESYYARIEAIKHFPPREKMKEIIMFRDILSMSITAGLSTAIKMTAQWYQSQAEQKELEKLHVESELNNLKNQLNPHFLFNTLNNIYSLIAIIQESAQKAVHQLSNLIRYVLYESDHSYVLLSKDLSFTANYIKLMSLRLHSHVSLETKISAETGDLEIAPLLFISLVENAFKHGVSPDKPSYISVNIKMTDSTHLVCRVENSNFPKNKADKSGSGIGLANLRKRLALLYPTTHELKIEDKGECYISELSLMLHK